MIGDRIKNLRELSGMTQSELAKRLGITRSSVNAWEMGVSAPSTQYLIELSRLFQISADHILELEEHMRIDIGDLDTGEKEVLLRLIALFRLNKSLLGATRSISDQEWEDAGVDLGDTQVLEKLGRLEPEFPE